MRTPTRTPSEGRRGADTGNEVPSFTPQPLAKARGQGESAHYAQPNTNLQALEPGAHGYVDILV